MHIRQSIIMHIALLVVLLTFPMDKGEGDGEKEGTARQLEQFDVTITPPAAEEMVVPEEGVGEDLIKRAPHAKDECAQSYGGIGVVESIDGVKEVYPGYPAALAGIQVGDEIISQGQIRGEVGTKVIVTVLRGMRRITFHMYRDKICTL